MKVFQDRNFPSLVHTRKTAVVAGYNMGGGNVETTTMETEAAVGPRAPRAMSSVTSLTSARSNR